MFKNFRKYLAQKRDLQFYSSLKPLPLGVRPRICFITAFRNRFEHLRTTLPQNIKNARSYANFHFILVNYGCPDPRTEDWARFSLPPLIEKGEVTYYRFCEPNRFLFAHARNIGLHLSDGELFCNVDADNFIGQHFPEYLASRMLESDRFVRLAGTERGAKGRICARLDDARAIGGYDENFSSWGADDGDFAERLRRAGKTQVTCYIPHFGHTVSHGDSLRTKETSLSIEESRKASDANRSRNRSAQVIKVTNPKTRIQLEKNFDSKVHLEF